ncbi:MAG: ATP-binding protein [Syntrophales bacterium]|nr:ATP-binding protein [Syntrophales bacterium]
MKISTRLKLAVFVPVTMALIVSLTLAFSYRMMEEIQANGNVVRQIRTSVIGLNHIAHSYILYREERPKQQFRAEHDFLMQLIASIRFRSPDHQQILDRISVESQLMKENFLKLVSYYERPASHGNDEMFMDLEERLVGQFLVGAQKADTDASLLRDLVDDDIRNAQAQTIALIFVVIFIAIVPLTIILFRTKRNIDASLTVLRTGTEAVGAGNLHHRIGISGDDELAELARSFDGMTGKLHEVTVSKDELQKEVEERKRAEKELKKRTFELEYANKELESFSYSISHDLRAPLRTINGFSAMLTEKLGNKLDEEGKRFLDTIRNSSKKMDNLICDLLAFSRVGRAELSRNTIDMSKLTDDLWQEQVAANPGRMMELKKGNLPQAAGDRTLIRQVLSNLLANAVKFSQKREPALIEIGGESSGRENVYCVRDNGTGFDMKYYEKLFGVFQRLHNEQEYEGTGVGLAIVRRIIQRHGGRVWAEGAVGKGAVFYFSLPAK